MSSPVPATIIRPGRLLLLIALLAAARPSFAQQAAISGSVVDAVGASIAQATVRLSADDGLSKGEVRTNDAGTFAFAELEPGTYRMSFAAEGFSTRVLDLTLRPDETVQLPPTVLSVAGFSDDVTVRPAQTAIAEAQVQAAETQRIAGLFPNYLANYDRNAAPLNVRQKFDLTWKSLIDPVAFVMIGVDSGLGQMRGMNPGFGGGAQGFAKRYASAFSESITHGIIAKVILPTVFTQDPRYFYKGEGTARSRAVYAASRSVICRGDNKRPQACYSSVLGRLASGALANLYLPPADRNSAGMVFENAALSTAENALDNLLQEFVARKLTRRK